MRGARWLALVGAALAGCLDFYSVPCGNVFSVCERQQVVSAAVSSWSFDGPCDGPGCVHRVVEGSAVLVASIHSSDRALELGRGTAVRFVVRAEGLPDGATLSLNARCTGAATLWWEGDGHDGAPGATPVMLAGPGGWRRVEQTLRVPAMQWDSLATMRAAGLTALEPQLRVRGEGTCVVDRVAYGLTASVCTSRAAWQARCRVNGDGGWFTRVDASAD